MKKFVFHLLSKETCAKKNIVSKFKILAQSMDFHYTCDFAKLTFKKIKLSVMRSESRFSKRPEGKLKQMSLLLTGPVIINSKP